MLRLVRLVCVTRANRGFAASSDTGRVILRTCYALKAHVIACACSGPSIHAPCRHAAHRPVQAPQRCGPQALEQAFYPALWSQAEVPRRQALAHV